jgi:hypothetical protein
VNSSSRPDTWTGNLLSVSVIGWYAFVVGERQHDSELDDLVSEAFKDDQRASLSDDAAESTDAGSPEREQAEHDHEVSVNSWRKVVARSEQLRKEAHPPN